MIKQKRLKSTKK